MLLEKGEIGRFPLGSNGTEKYDVVYLGGLFQNYMDSDVYEWLVNEYVFIFSTRLNNISKDSEAYGHVNIDLIRHDQFSYFHEYLRDKANYFVVQKEPIIINEFLEVIPEETEHGIQVIAHLKNQITKEKVKSNYFVLLMKTNDGRLNNLPKLELGPEFQAKIEHDKAMEHYYKLLDCSSILSTLANNTTDRNAFETVIDSLDKEIEYAKKEIDRAFNNYSSYRRSFEYVYKE